MVIKSSAQGEVKFVSYTGSYPNLCSGVLTLSVHGKKYMFGHSYNAKEGETLYPKFWTSGGDCGFEDGWSKEFVNYDEWLIDGSALPPELQKYEAEINDVFNANVPYGCCGGCL